MNVLMVGQSGVYNRGCEAIIRSTILMLSNHFPSLTVTLASFDYVNDIKHDFGFPVKVIPHLKRDLWRKWSFDWWVLKLGRLLGKDMNSELRFKGLSNYVKEADLVLSIGGDNYTEDYGTETLKAYLYLNQYVKSKGKKLIIWGASIGPFSEAGETLNVFENLKKVDGIMIRENESLEYLKKHGFQNLTRVADPAFLLPKKEVPIPSFICREGSTTVGFNVSPLLGRYRKSENGVDVFRAEAIRFLSELMVDKDINLILVPHVFDHKQGETDDIYYLENIYKELKNKERIFFPKENYNCEELKYIISKCDLYFGARTHTTIASLSLNIPTISIGYSIKAKGINQDIFGHQDYVLKSSEFSSKALLEKYQLLVERRSQITAQLTQVIPSIKILSLKALVALSK